jgi:hypothetical protein
MRHTTPAETLQREHTQLIDHLNRLQQHLEKATTPDRQTAVDAAALAIQIDHLKLIEQLITVQDDPDLLLGICREWLKEAEAAHCHAQDNALTPMRNDAWWATLDRVQFLAHLLDALEHPDKE